MMTETAKHVEEVMRALYDEAEATHLMRFFKCGPGEYGEGDRFLGIRVPATRSLIKRYRHNVEFVDCIDLIKSEWHEVRLAGFLFLIELYNKAKKAKNNVEVKGVVTKYIALIHFGNNWDLVDLVAPKLLGDYLVDYPDKRKILDELSVRTDSLWHQRVAIVATWTLICQGIYDETFRIAERYLTHSHDLIHKASGWMLREAGKRGGLPQLKEFLDKHAVCMPRTMLRYAIERFPESERQYYLKLKK